MTNAQLIERALSQFCSAHRYGGAFAVRTQCLFPSNGAVVVYVAGGENRCVVSDNGETARTVREHGIEVPNVSKWLKPYCEKYGLKHQSERLLSPELPVDRLESGIVLVANAAAQAARYAVENYAPATKHNLCQQIQERLIERFGKRHVTRESEIVGASSRKYRVDFLVRRRQQNPIAIDYVTPYASSINAKVAAHIDIGRIKTNKPEQAIIYDDSMRWQASDLGFLQTAAQLIPYSRMQDGLSMFGKNA